MKARRANHCRNKISVYSYIGSVAKRVANKYWMKVCETGKGKRKRIRGVFSAPQERKMGKQCDCSSRGDIRGQAKGMVVQIPGSEQF